MMDWGDMGYGSGAMVFGWLFAVLLIVGLVVLVVFLVGPRDTARSAPRDPGPPRSAAEAELELRYARGEIDAATLVEARSVLRQQ